MPNRFHDLRHRFIKRQALCLTVSSFPYFHLSFLGETLTNGNPVRYADEVRILELYAGAFITIINQDLHALVLQLCIKGFRS